jgi:hypothetical protein
MDKINLRDKFARFAEPWCPKIVGELNSQLVKLVKFQGRFRMKFRDRHVWFEAGEFLTVPRGIEHRLWWRRKPTSFSSSRHLH